MSTDWKEFSAEGLALANQTRWGDAKHAFEQALAILDTPDAQPAVTLAAHDDARARLLLNIGQCHFHLGALEESRRFCERSCAVRVGLYGEDSLVVARTRGDLAVILGASGHADEAMSLLERAVSAVERKRGAESEHLVPLLTNAARLLSRTEPDRAQAYIARLKALLFAQQMAAQSDVYPRTELPAHSFPEMNQSPGGDDHLLRSAIAETVDLLRSTPTANVAMPGTSWHSVQQENRADDQALADAAAVEVPWEYEVPAPVEQLAPPPAIASADELDDTVFDLVEPPPPTLNALPVTTPGTDQSNANPLGFEVQYGIPSQLHESFDNPTTPLPEDSNSSADATSDFAHAPVAARSGMRAVGGVRRGSAQLVPKSRVWVVTAYVAAFSGGIGAFLLYSYLKQ